MCIITDNEHIVRSVSIIPGLVEMPEGWHCYFPVKIAAKDLPNEGDKWMPED